MVLPHFSNSKRSSLDVEKRLEAIDSHWIFVSTVNGNNTNQNTRAVSI